jgi:hypothetical protein
MNTVHYRGYVIVVEYIHLDYTISGFWKHVDADGDNVHSIIREKLADVKREIDNAIAEQTTYLVHRFIPGKSNTITKFYFLQEAIEFCKQVGEDIGNIRTLFRGEEIHFDSI